MVQISPVNLEQRKQLGIRAGDTVRVVQKIEEKGKTRLQTFEGLVLARKHGCEPGATFTVRRVASGVGVEKIFPLYSPLIDKIEIVRRAGTRRSKLYYIREKVAKEIRRQMRRSESVSISTDDAVPETDAADALPQEEAPELSAASEGVEEGTATLAAASEEGKKE